MLSETVLVAIVAGAIGLIGTAGTIVATILGYRHASQLAANAEKNQRKNDLRKVLLSLNVAGPRWIRLQQIFIVALGATGNYADAQKFMMEFVDTDSGRDQGVTIQAFNAALIEANSIIDDADLLADIAHVRSMFQNFGESVQTPVLNSLRNARSAEEIADRVDEGVAYLVALQVAVTAVENRASKLLRGPIS